MFPVSCVGRSHVWLSYGIVALATMTGQQWLPKSAGTLHMGTCALVTTPVSVTTSLQALDDLVRKKIKDPSDFEWQKQARFYWLEERTLAQISICDVDFEYSFEYLGEPGVVVPCVPPSDGSAGTGTQWQGHGTSALP